MAFEGLSEKLNAAFKRLRGKGRLTENDVREAMREVRLALLEADVSYKVVKEFVATVTERSVGTAVLDARSAGGKDRQRGTDEPHGRRHRQAGFRQQWPHDRHDGGPSGRR